MRGEEPCATSCSWSSVTFCTRLLVSVPVCAIFLAALVLQCTIDFTKNSARHDGPRKTTAPHLSAKMRKSYQGRHRQPAFLVFGFWDSRITEKGTPSVFHIFGRQPPSCFTFGLELANVDIVLAFLALHRIFQYDLSWAVKLNFLEAYVSPTVEKMSCLIQATFSESLTGNFEPRPRAFPLFERISASLSLFDIRFQTCSWRFFLKSAWMATRARLQSLHAKDRPRR